MKRCEIDFVVEATGFARDMVWGVRARTYQVGLAGCKLENLGRWWDYY